MRFLSKREMHKKSSQHFLVLDIGTTGIKSLVFDARLNVRARSYRPLVSGAPKRGWVEQNPSDLVRLSVQTMREAVKKSGVLARSIVSWGMTNQRETVILWDAQTGRPVYPAIVWKDERTAKACERLGRAHERWVREKTGLSLIPYFSASKIQWVLRHVPQCGVLLAQSRLRAGTVDSWIAWNLLHGQPHVTDITNASRTLLYNIRLLEWDHELLAFFDIPKSILPIVHPSGHRFGVLSKDILGREIPLRGILGDQQASMVAAGVRKGSTKVTCGTGTFLMQVGGSRMRVFDGLFTTLVPHGKNAWYAVEEKVPMYGAQIERILKKSNQLEKELFRFAQAIDRGLKRLPIRPRSLAMDGGVTRDGILAQFQRRVSAIPIRQHPVFDGTAYGVAKFLRDM
ncbi:hypothetical protein HY627_00470 [Candidatus Uhrbacteria bacterium]|nr:hypothetical protein [Candidatus Uhrbacteria bacterium]